MAECSSQRPASQEMKLRGACVGGTRGEVFRAQVHYKYKERLGCFLGIVGGSRCGKHSWLRRRGCQLGRV